MLFPKKKKKKKKSQLQHGNPQTQLPRNLHAEEARDAFIKFELRVSEVASLAKKPVMLTAMLINIALLLIFSLPVAPTSLSRSFTQIFLPFFLCVFVIKNQTPALLLITAFTRLKAAEQQQQISCLSGDLWFKDDLLSLSQTDAVLGAGLHPPRFS